MNTTATEMCSLLSPTAQWKARDDVPLGSHPAGIRGLQCFHRVLQMLMSGDCIVRASFEKATVQRGSPPTATRAASAAWVDASFELPTYALTVPKLAVRYKAINNRLRMLSATNVTFVNCANKEDVQMLAPSDRSCLHPKLHRHQFQIKSQQTELANGTLSLAIKHYLAYFDILRRRLPLALVLEDDAEWPRQISSLLARYRMPCDADIFYLSSYFRSNRAHSCGENGDPVVTPQTWRPRVHRRRNGSKPVASSAYIIFAAQQTEHPSAEGSADPPMVSQLPNPLPNPYRPLLPTPLPTPSN